MDKTSFFPRKFDPCSPEMMDRREIDNMLLQLQLRSLRQINRYFGGNRAYEWIYQRLQPPPEGEITVLDLCTGSGDHPRYLLERNPRIRLIATDFQAKTLRTAQQCLGDTSAQCIQTDVLRLPFKDHSIDFVLCSLALHHFSDENAKLVLKEIQRVARLGGAVIDLTRGIVAYLSVWLLTTLWMRDPYTVHDGRASVRAAFTPYELVQLAVHSEWTNCWHLNLPWFRQAIGFRLLTMNTPRSKLTGYLDY